VAGELVRGARLRAIQGGDQFFGGGEGSIMTDRYLNNVLSWFNHTYQEVASNIMTASLLNPITDMIQNLATPLATTRIMEAVIRVAQKQGGKADLNILSRLGMSEEMTQRVFQQFMDGERTILARGPKGEAVPTDVLDLTQVMILPKFDTWSDQALAQNFMSLIGGDIRTATLHPSIASNRIWKGMGPALMAVSRLYYLFTRWAFMAQSNIYDKNIEDRTYRHIGSTMLYATVVQMAVNWLKEPDWVEESYLERAKDAFVMSGALGYMGILNERLERLSGHTLGIRPMLGMETFANDPGHLGFRLSGLSPVTGKLGGMYQAAEEMQFGRLGRLFTPYQNWWLWAGAVRDGSEIFDVEQD